MQRLRLLIGAGLFIIVDQAVKNFIKDLAEKGDITIRGVSFFSFSYQCNQGIAFGITFNKLLTIVLAFLIIVLLIFLLHKGDVGRNEKQAIYLIIIAGTANAIDRLIHGCVTDYISVGRWPVFNLPDLVIVVSVGYIFFLNTIRNQQKRGS